MNINNVCVYLPVIAEVKFKKNICGVGALAGTGGHQVLALGGGRRVENFHSSQHFMGLFRSAPAIFWHRFK